MWISEIVLNTLAFYSEKKTKVKSMGDNKKSSSMNKTEKFVNLLHVISQAPGRKIGYQELHRVLGNPSRASFHKLVAELKSGTAFMPPLLSESKHQSLEDRIYKLNSKAWDNFVTAGSEGYFFLEAFRRLGKIINSDYTKLNFEDVIEFEGRKVVDLDRKFMYLSKIDAKVTPKLTHMVDQLVTALLEHRQVKIIYKPTGLQGEYERIIEPLTLCQYRDDLYIMCYKVEAGEKIFRNYKISRIDDLEIQEDNFEYPSSSKWNPEKDYKNASGLINGKSETALIKVYGPTRQIFQEKNFFNNLLVQNSDEFSKYQCTYTSLNEIVGQLFVYAEDIEILAPKELKDAFTEKALKALSINKVKIDKKAA